MANMNTNGDKTLNKSGESVQCSVTELQELDTSRPDSSETESERWQPGFWRRFPWLGAGAMISAILITVFQIIILEASHKKAVSQWNIPVIPYTKAKWPAPNVILSILNSLANIGFTVAVGQGIAIAWWRKALKGTSIKELHNTWSFGGSVSAILLNLKYFNFAALAAIVTKLTIIDGVLFQRATTTYTALGPQITHNITTYPVSRLPGTAFVNEFLNGTKQPTYAFTYDVSDWIHSAYGNIWATYGYTDCDGICALDVLQPGYVATCVTDQQNVDLLAFNTSVNGTVDSTKIFEVNFNVTYNTPEKNYTWIGLNYTGYGVQENPPYNNSGHCPGTLYNVQCELRQRIINYPVYMERTSIASKSSKNATSYVKVYLGGLDQENGTYQGLGAFDYGSGQLPGFTPWKPLASEGSAPKPGSLTVNGGIYEVLQNQYGSQAHIKINKTSGDWSLETKGQFAPLMEYYNVTAEYGDSCPYAFQDPSTDIMTGLNMLTFITANDLWNRWNWTNGNLTNADSEAYQNDSRVFQVAREYLTEVHYQTNRSFMFGALASTLVCVLLILPVYWGFWELGRPVSLNPIEIATAFQAPMLVPLQPRSGYADDLVKVAGPQQVKYAEVAEGSGSNSQRLRFVSSNTQSATKLGV